MVLIAYADVCDHLPSSLCLVVVMTYCMGQKYLLLTHTYLCINRGKSMVSMILVSKYAICSITEIFFTLTIFFENRNRKKYLDIQFRFEASSFYLMCNTMPLCCILYLSCSIAAILSRMHIT